jgi:mono/diheme cytochrome c family protein
MATTLDFQLVKTAGIRQTSSRMKRSCGFLFSVALGMLIYAQPPTARAQVAQTINVTSHLTPTPRPPMTAALATNILVWDAETKTIEVHEGEPQGHLAFTFTNVSTNNVVISNVHPGCGCTTAQLPPLPWTNAPGATGRIGVTINVHGTATLFKNLTVTTDKGIKTLTFYVHILPLVLPIRTENERANDIKIAQTNRQAIFQAQCALCHVKPGDGKYGKSLYDADCAICHESAHRIAQVPDLHALTVPTNAEFWRNWIAHGKPGSLMPAFAATDGGPLNDLQISTLTQYLSGAIQSRIILPNPAAGATANKP